MHTLPVDDSILLPLNPRQLQKFCVSSLTCLRPSELASKMESLWQPTPVGILSCEERGVWAVGLSIALDGFN